MNPRITVLLPVYNALPHLEHTVDSLYRQTLKEFKVLVFDDGSTDGSGEFLDRIDDRRFEIIHQDNVGLAVTLNRMLEMVDTEFIARLDSDDICLPGRLKRQLEFMIVHPEVAVAGTRGGYILGRKSRASIGFGRRKITLSYAPPMSNPPYWNPLKDKGILIHSTVMMRTQALREVGGYPDMVPGQDFALWHKMAHAGMKMANIDEMLLLSRVARSGISSSNLIRQYQSWNYTSYMSECLLKGESPMTLDQYSKEHPLSESRIRILRTKAQLRNSLADMLSFHFLMGVYGLLRVAITNPRLIREKIKNRL